MVNLCEQKQLYRIFIHLQYIRKIWQLNEGLLAVIAAAEMIERILESKADANYYEPPTPSIGGTSR